MNSVVDPPDPAPPNPDYAAATARLFAAQPVMAFLGAELGVVAPGRVTLELPYRPELCQQDGFLHAGVVTALLDNACGGAAFTLMPVGSSVLAVEFKVNLLAPAAGEAFVARAEVRRAGRTLSVCQAELFAQRGSEEKLVALMQATMMAVAR
jgi:uncharacterized protein (TIGR00369 family)